MKVFLYFFPTRRRMNSPALLMIIMMLLATGRHSEPLPIPTCPTSCGNLTIPFPFGTSSDCNLDDSFLITCNNDSYNPPKPFLNLGSIEVLDISLDGQMRVASSVASYCYDDSGSRTKRTISELNLSKFLISSSQNKFTAVGCDTVAFLQDSTGKNMSAGCISQCDGIDRLVNGTCSGIGCCQTSIPKGVKDFLVEIRSFRNHTVVNSSNPCGYAFVAETETFKFSSSDLKDLQNRKYVPVVLDWSVGYLSCQEAQKNVSSFGCLAAHSECVDSSSGVGYLCKCMTGFQGNPYHVDGCRDINECIDLEPCEGTCKNLLGSYSCSCPKGFEGDGKKDGEGCHSKRTINGSTFFYMASGLVVPAVGSSWIFWRRKQKKVDRLRRNLFLRNGGQLLEGKVGNFRAEELKKATNNYNKDNVLSGELHDGIKYRGILPDGVLVTVVTIATHDAVEECNIEEFISNLIILSELHHRNIVRLLGCCLETQAPILVFERFEPETLHDLIHDNHRARNLSWDIRLRIASETARVLEYIHCCFSIQMIHGRLSSSSIVLDNVHMVKLHDMDLIRHPQIPWGQRILGRVGYLDPHYLVTNELTVKSDVYSFGVVLAEILTGQKVISGDRPPGEGLLAQYFLTKTDDDLAVILDPRLESDGKIDQLTQIAALAKRCLSRLPDDRPTMTEVVTALNNIYGSETTCPDPDQ